jgi:hypothetical protein
MVYFKTRADKPRRLSHALKATKLQLGSLNNLPNKTVSSETGLEGVN